MNELKIFENTEFGQVRTVEVAGKIYFVASDIAKSLGYSNVSDAISRHCKGVVKHDIPHPQSADKSIEMNVIPEGDIYRLVVKSELPSAEKFESWVFDEILPIIRKTGGYSKIPISKKEEIRLYLEALDEQDAKIEAVNKDLQEFKLDMPLLGIECEKITTAVKSKGINCLGGKGARAYSDKSLRGKIYTDIHNQLRREFGVSSYKAIKRNQVDTAIDIIKQYSAPFILKESIQQQNNQLSI